MQTLLFFFFVYYYCRVKFTLQSSLLSTVEPDMAKKEFYSIQVYCSYKRPNRKLKLNK